MLEEDASLWASTSSTRSYLTSLLEDLLVARAVGGKANLVYRSLYGTCRCAGCIDGNAPPAFVATIAPYRSWRWYRYKVWRAERSSASASADGGRVARSPPHDTTAQSRSLRSIDPRRST